MDVVVCSKRLGAKYEFNWVGTRVGAGWLQNIDVTEFELGCLQGGSKVEGGNDTCETFVDIHNCVLHQNEHESKW